MYNVITIEIIILAQLKKVGMVSRIFNRLPCCSKFLDKTLMSMLSCACIFRLNFCHALLM